ncbi:anti-sigma factor [Virgibacillus sp. C22-A2]|uniref:Anti-sigma factor n=1 Tax=Virgibacillus tibetensis TaxID=3042313 RepID=A0ABU6KGD8_9BACI|nr:anti-sigma factor [Virgibacillus sp. C22-A2]
MSDEFKKKLEAYEKGALPEAELAEFEKDLEKLESYQEFLEETKTIESNGTTINEKKKQKILRRGKWKARLQTAITALGIFLLFTIVSSILTAIYYSWGSPDRLDVYRSIIDHTLTVTEPYGYMGNTSTNSKLYFGLEATRDIQKGVGNETKKVGEMEINFFFSMMGYPEREYYGDPSQNNFFFSYPGSEVGDWSDWNKLEKLPEGTVVSAHVSFAELLETDEVFQLLEGKEIRLTWLAVDTGLEANNEFNDGVILDPIGFPSFPIWHEEDMILNSREEEKGLFGSKIVSESYSSPDYEEGEEGILQQQFLKTLYFLKDHERKVNNLVFGKLELSERIDYLEKSGFQHYGVVITGPTKEVLKLKNESWVGELKVDEVSFWNWDN